MKRNQEREVWKQIKNYEGIYEVSNLGQIRRVDKISHDGAGLKENLKSQRVSNCGYKLINLYKFGKQKTATVHRLVAAAFIDNSDNLPEVGHLDDNKQNNNVNNLYWTNHKENMVHNNRHLKASKKCCKKIKGTQNGLEIIFNSGVEASKYGFVRSGISNCIAGRHRTYKGYKWEFIN